MMKSLMLYEKFINTMLQKIVYTQSFKELGQKMKHAFPGRTPQKKHNQTMTNKGHNQSKQVKNKGQGNAFLGDFAGIL